MARLTPETVRAVARQIYDYDLADDAAASIAHIVGAMATYSRRLESLQLGGLQPSFGYPALVAEATRLHERTN
jgi:hypothetical protein